MKEIISGMSNKEYHSHKSYSKSSLDLFNADPYAVEWARKVKSEKSPALSFGTATHAMLLEPKSFERDYIVAPKINRQTNAGKEKWAEFLESAQNKIILKNEEKVKLDRIKDSVMSHKQCRDLIEAEGHVEESFFWEDEETGLDLRCRPDKRIPDRQILLDFKTTADLSKFCYSVEDYRYHVQDPFYCDGVNIVTGGNYEMLFLVIQTTQDCGRYPVRIFRLPEYATEYGRRIYRQDLNNLSEFIQSGYAETQELLMSRRFEDAAYAAAGEVIL